MKLNTFALVAIIGVVGYALFKMIKSGAQYTLTVFASPTYAGTASVTTGQKATYNYGDIVTLTATPNSGFSFQFWQTELGEVVGYDAIQNYMITGSHVLTAMLLATP